MTAENDKSISKILIIDDESDIRELFKYLLEEEGHIVITAVDGTEGIKINNESDPDIIILDLKMPNMSGIETLQNIRKTDSDVTVIVLTGYGSADTVREAAELNVYEYISKPFVNEVIISVIKEALEQ